MQIYGHNLQKIAVCLDIRSRLWYIVPMKTTISKEQYEAIYERLNRVDVLDYDCGTLCGAACCTVSREDAAEDMGIYLLPGEERLHLEDDWMELSEGRAEDHDLPESWEGEAFFGRCKTPPVCPRGRRPIQCRTFPLAPHINEDGELIMIYNDLELPYACPLIEEEIPLEDEFVNETLDVWRELITDPLIYDLVKMDSEAREESFRELMDKLGL